MCRASGSCWCSKKRSRSAGSTSRRRTSITLRCQGRSRFAMASCSTPAPFDSAAATRSATPSGSSGGSRSTRRRSTSARANSPCVLRVATSSVNPCPCHVPTRLTHRSSDVRGRVVKASETGCGGERGQEPGADYAVVDRHVSPGRVAASGRRGRLGDNVVLVVRLRKPRWNRTASEEAEERVALDENTRLEAVRQDAPHR